MHIVHSMRRNEVTVRGSHTIKQRWANTVVLNLFHCWDPLNATDVVWDPQVKIDKVCAPE